jgi:hypothetical protein
MGEGELDAVLVGEVIGVYTESVVRVLGTVRVGGRV